MQLIPVIDLKDGIVVHAKLGLRSQYRPICTALCPEPAIEKVIAAFLSVYAFPIFYIADLNAITHQGNNQTLLTQILSCYPQLTFWIDRGYQAKPDDFFALKNHQAILGSESYTNDTVKNLAAFEKNFILSLDFSAHAGLGASSLFTQTAVWPEKIILMTLAQVGSGLGVDMQKLLYYQTIAPDKQFIASGGIRNKQDLDILQKQGIEYALCASALHNGAIRREDLVLMASA